MREILFRGKRLDNGEWVYGFYWNRGELAHFIKVIDKDGNLVGDYEIALDTLGEYTGLIDRNGVKIFEGDILTAKLLTDTTITVAVKYSERKAFYWACGIGKSKEWVYPISYGNPLFAISCNAEKTYEVIGNIHDNPELLK